MTPLRHKYTRVGIKDCVSLRINRVITMPAQVANKPPALKRPMYFANRPEAQFAKKPVAPMRVVPVGMKPPALKRGQHVCKYPEPTTAEAYDPMASQEATDAFFAYNIVRLAGV